MNRQQSGRQGSERWPAWVRYLLYFLLIVGMASYFSGRSGGPTEGEPAMPFSLASVAGTHQLKLEDFRGRPVLIEVFASWCSSCRKAAPMVAELAEQHRAQVDFIGINVDESLAQARAVVQQWNIRYPVAHDDGSFSRAYRIQSIPTFVLIDQDGTVLHTATGIPHRAKLQSWFDELGGG